MESSGSPTLARHLVQNEEKAIPPLFKRKVLIADDHPLSAQGIASLLQNDFEVVGVVPDGLQLLDEAERLQPDVITLDISMPMLNGMEAARRLRELLPRAKLIFITQEVDLRYLRAALRTGAKGYVAKSSAAREVVSAVNRVVAGGTYITPALEEAYAVLTPAQASAGEDAEQLTERQRQVLQLVAEGHSTRAMADILKVSPKTIEFHKERLMAALGVRTTAELIRYAVAHGIVSG